jgi:hypothetical protein
MLSAGATGQPSKVDAVRARAAVEGDADARADEGVDEGVELGVPIWADTVTAGTVRFAPAAIGLVGGALGFPLKPTAAATAATETTAPSTARTGRRRIDRRRPRPL